MFPKDFVWGVATSSYQIEGASLEDGRGECIWHRFSHTPGKVYGNHNGDVACDHYHRYPEDVQIMQSLGVRGYRFSISWPRVLPKGIGQTNEKGLDFYDRLVDSILAAGIEPYLTLYHWDLPQALQDKGGWTNPDIVKWFADYAGLMAGRLGDRVKNWVTHNEPWVISLLAHWLGEHAPGYRNLPMALAAAHYVMLSHGAAVPVIRQHVPDGRVGIVIDQVYIQPASQSEADQAAARLEDSLRNLWFLDPVYKGHYPADALTYYEQHLQGLDVSAISAAQVPIDFIGINYYTRQIVRADGERVILPEMTFTAQNWEIYPEGLYQLLLRLQREYAPSGIYITENGASFDDPLPANGIVHDPQRVEYLRGHFDAAERAIANGVALKGYFVWSFLDNFEWAYGYDKRFGIVYVDFETLQRTPKRSALYLKEIISQTS